MTQTKYLEYRSGTVNIGQFRLLRTRNSLDSQLREKASEVISDEEKRGGEKTLTNLRVFGRVCSNRQHQGHGVIQSARFRIAVGNHRHTRDINFHRVDQQ